MRIAPVALKRDMHQGHPRQRRGVGGKPGLQSLNNNIYNLKLVLFEVLTVLRNI